MARSKKEQVNVKLEFAKNAIMSVIVELEDEVMKYDEQQIRNDPELYKKSEKLKHYRIVLANIMKLYSTSAKKQGTRMILAVCAGELKSGELCLYKIRASMAMYLRGIPNCPDPLCKRRGKPLEAQIENEDVDEALAQTLGEEIMSDLERQEKRRKEAHAKFDKPTLAREMEDRLTNPDDEEWLKNAGKL